MTKKPKQTAAKVSKSTQASTKEPVLLSGGNPQIAKADGDAPVLAALVTPPWNLVLSQTAVPGAVPLLVDHLIGEGVSLPGVVSLEPTGSM